MSDPFPARSLSRCAVMSITFLILAPMAMANDDADQTVTFSRDIAPIFQRSCQKCHRPGEVAPMSLMSYEDVRPWAKAIKKQVVTREMPPWDVAPGGDWHDDPSLSEKEIAMVSRWVDTGAPQGDPAHLPPPVQFPSGWVIGEPDLVLEIGEDYEVPAEGYDRFEFFELPTGLAEERWVSAVQVIPGNRKVVHHVMAYINQIQDDNDEDGWRVGRRGRHRNLLTEFAVGNFGDVFKEGTGKLLKPGSSISLEIHYHPYGQPETDRTKIGLKFHPKGTTAKRVYSKGISSRQLDIPPGEPSVKSEAEHYLSEPIEVISFQPHMHCRGKSMDLEAILPDGTRQMLCSVPTFNFNWQITYTFKNPPRLPAGTMLKMTAHHDNSAANPNNPDPTTHVWWGPQTTDEMAIGWTDYVIVEDEQKDEPQEEQIVKTSADESAE